MAKALQEWTVTPHSPLTAVGSNVLTVTGDIRMPIGAFPRRMTVVRLNDDRLVIFSAIALDEDEMSQLESYGTPAFMVVPNAHHCMDAKIWKDRYPQLQVIAPEGARTDVEKAVHVDSTRGDFRDPDVVLITVPGTHGHEAALEINGPDGLTLVLNDLVGNIRDASGFRGWLLRVMGFAGDQPKIPMPVKATIVDDQAALRAQLLRWADQPALKRVLVSHGGIIDDQPGRVLRELAETLH